MRSLLHVRPRYTANSEPHGGLVEAKIGRYRRKAFSGSVPTAHGANEVVAEPGHAVALATRYARLRAGRLKSWMGLHWNVLPRVSATRVPSRPMVYLKPFGKLKLVACVAYAEVPHESYRGIGKPRYGHASAANKPFRFGSRSVPVSTRSHRNPVISTAAPSTTHGALFPSVSGVVCGSAPGKVFKSVVGSRRVRKMPRLHAVVWAAERVEHLSVYAKTILLACASSLKSQVAVLVGATRQNQRLALQRCAGPLLHPAPDTTSVANLISGEPNNATPRFCRRHTPLVSILLAVST